MTEFHAMTVEKETMMRDYLSWNWARNLAPTVALAVAAGVKHLLVDGMGSVRICTRFR
jgi:hypothetical protein